MKAKDKTYLIAIQTHLTQYLKLLNCCVYVKKCQQDQATVFSTQHIIEN